MVSAAVESIVFVEVDQVGEILVAVSTSEALRMPKAQSTCPLGVDTDRARVDRFLALNECRR